MRHDEEVTGKRETPGLDTYVTPEREGRRVQVAEHVTQARGFLADEAEDGGPFQKRLALCVRMRSRMKRLYCSGDDVASDLSGLQQEMPFARRREAPLGFARRFSPRFLPRLLPRFVVGSVLMTVGLYGPVNAQSSETAADVGNFKEQGLPYMAAGSELDAAVKKAAAQKMPLVPASAAEAGVGVPTHPSVVRAPKQPLDKLTPTADSLDSGAVELLSRPVLTHTMVTPSWVPQYGTGLDVEPIGGGTLERYLPLTPAPPKQTGWLPDSFDDWLEWNTMTGDWNGWRPKLQDNGVTISGRWLQDSAANLTGGMSQTMQFADEEAFSVDLDLKKLLRLDRDYGTIHFTTAIRQGHSLASSMPALDSPMEIAGSGEWAHLTKLSWEFQWNKYVRTEIGELNSEDQFEASSTYWGANLYCQFESNAICGMPQSISMNSGYGWYPTAHPGVWAKFFLTGTPEWTLQVGAYTADRLIDKKKKYGWKMGFKGTTGAFVPVQFRWHKGGPDDYTGEFQTNITVGAYWDSSNVDNVYSKFSMFTITPPANAMHYHANADCGDTEGTTCKLQGWPGQLQKTRNRHGAYFQADSLLQRDKDDPRRSTAGFFSFTWGNRAASPAPYFVTAGVTRKGTFASRPADTVSLGMKALWASTKLSHDVTQMRNFCTDPRNASNDICQISRRSHGLYVPTAETALEFNYGYRPAWWALIRPGIQYIWRPGGTRRYKDAFLLDLEAGLTF